MLQPELASINSQFQSQLQFTKRQITELQDMIKWPGLEQEASQKANTVRKLKNMIDYKINDPVNALSLEHKFNLMDLSREAGEVIQKYEESLQQRVVAAQPKPPVYDPFAPNYNQAPQVPAIPEPMPQEEYKDNRSSEYTLGEPNCETPGNPDFIMDQLLATWDNVQMQEFLSKVMADPN